MTPEVAKNALEFLKRVDLKGTEARAMFQCQAELQNEAHPAPPPTPIDPPTTGVNIIDPMPEIDDENPSEDSDGNDNTTG